VGNVAERGPLTTARGPRQHSEKGLEMKVYSDVDFYILKPEITGKQQSKNSQKTTTYWKPKEYRNISKMEDQFLHLACQGRGSHPCTPSVTPLL